MHVCKHIISEKDVMKQVKEGEKNKSQICALAVNQKDLIQRYLVSGRDFQDDIFILIMFQRTIKYSGVFYI